MLFSILLTALLSARVTLAGKLSPRQTQTVFVGNPPGPQCSLNVTGSGTIEITRHLAAACQTYETNRIVFTSFRLAIPGTWVHACFGTTTTTRTQIETRAGVCWADKIETTSTTMSTLSVPSAWYGPSTTDVDITVRVTSTARYTFTLPMATETSASVDTTATHLAPPDSSTSIPIFPSPSTDPTSSTASGFSLSARSSVTLDARPSASSTVMSALDATNNSQQATSGLSTGSIVGIVVACLIVLLVVATGSFIIGRHRKSKPRERATSDHREKIANKVRDLEEDRIGSAGTTPTCDFGRSDVVSPMQEDIEFFSPTELPGCPGALAELGHK